MNIFDSVVDCLIMMYILIQTFIGSLLIGDFILYNNSIDSLMEAEMYIFDEPNASLDIASEQAVLNMIWDEMRDKIAILIMHGFNCMLERADKIIVLENGEIEEIGKHVELLKYHGLYYRLYRVQKEMSLSDE